MAKTSKTPGKKTVKKSSAPKRVMKKLKPEELKNVTGGGKSVPSDSWIEC